MPTRVKQSGSKFCRVSWKVNDSGYHGRGKWFSLHHESMLLQAITFENSANPRISHWIEYTSKNVDPTEIASSN
jgi:hypothetical protein